VPLAVSSSHNCEAPSPRAFLNASIMDIKVAILVDGSYFLKRYNALNKNTPKFNKYDPVQTAKDLSKITHDHLNSKNAKIYYYLYRIFYYDCLPFSKKVHNPITKKIMDFSKTKVAKFRLALFEELKKQRKEKV